MFHLTPKWIDNSDKTISTCEIFLDHSIEISWNKSDDGDEWFYNAWLLDEANREIESLDGAETIEKAKENAEKWLLEQCKTFFSPVD